jgi:DNA invertase Pin-like site-specific DNA recombinase
MDGYIRVSRVQGRGGESYYTTKEQREEIEAWAKYKQVEIARWHEDEDESGGTHERPGLEAAIDRALDGETDGIVSMRINRFSRNTESGLRDLRRLREKGARLVFATEDIDTSTSAGKMIYGVMLSMSEFFLDEVKRTWKATKKRAVERGALIGNTPLGYVREEGVLVRSGLAPRIREAFLLAAGDIYAAREHLRRYVPERSWDIDDVRRLLRNRAYLGEVRYGDLANRKAHDPIATKREWESAQSNGGERKASEDYPLSGGLATCASCGRHLCGGRTGRDNHRTYRCTSMSKTAHRDLDCEAPAMIAAHLLEGYCKDKVLERMRRLSGWAVAERAPTDVSELEQALGLAEGELIEFAADTTMRRALKDRYHEQLEARERARDEAQAAYRAALKQSPAPTKVMPPEVVELADARDLRELFAAAFDSIVVTKGRLPVARKVRLKWHDVAVTAAQNPEASGL